MLPYYSNGAVHTLVNFLHWYSYFSKVNWRRATVYFSLSRARHVKWLFSDCLVFVCLLQSLRWVETLSLSPAAVQSTVPIVYSKSIHFEHFVGLNCMSVGPQQYTAIAKWKVDRMRNSWDIWNTYRDSLLYN